MGTGKSEGKSIPFYIAAPEDCKEDLKEILKSISLDKKRNIRRVFF
jgi:hypothetical protein